MRNKMYSEHKFLRLAKKMELYYFWKSEYSSMVRLVLLEFYSHTVTLHEVDLTKHEQLQPFFCHINPSMQIPTLVVSSSKVITESVNISKYIVPKNGWTDKAEEMIQRIAALPMYQITYGYTDEPELKKKQFLQTLFKERPTVMKNILLSNSSLSEDMKQNYANRIRIYETEMIEQMSDPVIVQHCWKKIDEFLVWLEQQLSKLEDPILGVIENQFSVADCHLIPIVARIISLEREHLISQKPKLYQWWKQMQKRDSFRKVFDKKCETHPNDSNCFCK